MFPKATLLALLTSSAIVLAQSSSSGPQSASDCPAGSSFNSNGNGPNFCCPGPTSVDGDGVYCLLGCTLGFPDGFPNCSGSIANSQTTSGVCTPVPVTASDYSSRVFGSGAAAAATSGSGSGSGSNNASTTASSGSSQTTTAGGATQTATSSSSHNAGPQITVAPVMAFGAVLAGALIL